MTAAPPRPRVLLDCDGVLSDFAGGLLPIIAEVAQREVLLEAWTAWDFASSFGLTAEQKKEVGDRLVAQPGFCDGLAVCAGAVEGVRLLADVAEIYVVTSPWDSCPTWEYERKAWLWRHLGIPKRNVLQGAANHLIGGEILVDDKTPTLHAWASAHPEGEPIRWVTLHNRAEPLGGLETCDWEMIRRRAEAAYMHLRGEESAL